MFKINVGNFKIRKKQVLMLYIEEVNQAIFILKKGLIFDIQGGGVK